MQSPTRTFIAALPSLALGLALLSGCQKAAAPPEPAPEAGEHAVSVSLSAEDVKRLGVVAVEPQAAVWTPESLGYAVVVSHEGIAQPVAELASAQAADRQSRAAVARTEQLAGGAGALSAEARDNAERQAGIDAAALSLAERRLSTVIGEQPAWPQGNTAGTLAALASGRIKLVRVTFPLASALPAKLGPLRLGRLDAAATDPSPHTSAPWPAPADPAMPGRSFFALLSDASVSEGERLEAWAPVGAVQHGLLIPAAAVVQSEGKYWCYVETEPGGYLRTAIDTQRPLDSGYFASDGFTAGQRVVSTAAALLLARELNPSTEAE